LERQGKENVRKGNRIFESKGKENPRKGDNI